ncbi:MAG: tetratricopeptide repeat protein, partial [Leptospiraceae bacterium]|nr:tetratricopeptide repeat protein [Leptospiraceae bacterium]
LRGRILLVEMDAVDEALRDFHECVRGLNNEKLIRQYLQANRLLDHLHLCGMRFLLQSKMQETLSCYNLIIELLSSRVKFLTSKESASLARAYHYRGQAYLESEGKSNAAIQDFNHACSIYDEMEDAMTPEYWNNLAGVLRSRGNYYASVDSPEDAKENHAKSLEIRKRLRNQDYPDIEIHLAESLDAYGLGLLLNGKIEESLIYFEQASSTVPGHSTYNLACAHARLGNLNTAFDFLEQNRDSDFKQPREHVEQDTDLTSLHSDPRWSQLLKNWDKTE